jgi:tetratricopeptide (TPR) repeat protein
LAQRQFEAATALDPRYAEAFINLGNVLNVQGRSTEALEQFRKAVVVDWEHAGRAYAKIAATEKGLGEAELARSARQEAIVSARQNEWCGGNPDVDDATLHGCSKDNLSEAVQASVQNAPDWPDAPFAPADCKTYANETGP